MQDSNNVFVYDCFLHYIQKKYFEIIDYVIMDNNQEMIKFVKLENSDIERSEIVKKVIEIYNFNVRQQINIIPIQDIKPLNINNDASLIPKHHMTDNFDIF